MFTVQRIVLMTPETVVEMSGNPKPTLSLSNADVLVANPRGDSSELRFVAFLGTDCEQRVTAELPTFVEQPNRSAVSAVADKTLRIISTPACLSVRERRGLSQVSIIRANCCQVHRANSINSIDSG